MSLEALDEEREKQRVATCGSLRLPDVAIETPDAILDTELRPVFDSLWRAGGWPASPS